MWVLETELRSGGKAASTSGLSGLEHTPTHTHNNYTRLALNSEISPDLPKSVRIKGVRYQVRLQRL